MTRAAGPDSYLRRMGLAFVTRDGVVTGEMPALGALCSVPGRPRVGALAVLADCVAGYNALADFDMAWVATSSLAVHGPFRDTEGPVLATGALVGRRRTGGVYEITLGSGDGGPAVGAAVVTLGLLSRQGHDRSGSTLAARAARSRARVASGPDGEVRCLADIVAPVDAGRPGGGLRLEVGDHLRNSWGALAGGISALLTELEAERLATASVGRPCTVGHLEVHFVAPGRSGPIEARGTVVSTVPAGSGPSGDRPGGGVAHVRVRVVDTGADDRLIAIATATATAGATGVDASSGAPGGAASGAPGGASAGGPVLSAGAARPG